MIKEIIVFSSFSALGGLIKYANEWMEGKREFNPRELKSWVFLVIQIATSFFVGSCLYFYSEYSQLSPHLAHGFAGVAGYFGSEIFKLIRRVSEKVIEIKLGLKKDE